MKCVIVAAGQGVRLRNGEELKPLVRLRGLALIEHVIGRCRLAGVDEFIVVGGYRGNELQSSLSGVSSGSGGITYVDNPEWRRANGVSLSKARDHLNGPFVLTMCDHLFDPALMRGLIGSQPRPQAVTLAVDYRIEGTIHDMDDVTRVCCNDGRINSIGKHLTVFNCFDTGVFFCDPVMFEALAESQDAGDDSISGAMNVLARRGLALGYDVGDKPWIDVDDFDAFCLAQSMIESGRL